MEKVSCLGTSGLRKDSPWCNIHGRWMDHCTISAYEQENFTLRSERDEAMKMVEKYEQLATKATELSMSMVNKLDSQSALIEKLKEGMGGYEKALEKIWDQKMPELSNHSTERCMQLSGLWMSLKMIAKEGLASARKVGM